MPLSIVRGGDVGEPDSGCSPEPATAVAQWRGRCYCNDRKKGIVVLWLPLNPLTISVQSPALTNPGSSRKVQEVGTNLPALMLVVNMKIYFFKNSLSQLLLTFAIMKLLISLFPIHTPSLLNLAVFSEEPMVTAEPHRASRPEMDREG